MVGPLLVAFVAGVAMFGTVRYWVQGTPAATANAVIALIIILVLGLYYYRSRRRERLRLAGDNLYYLGLLFTLGSLIMALVQLFVFETDEGDLRQRTHDLIGNFAIALSSTVAGIFGRILLHSAEDEKVPEGKEPAPEVLDSEMELRRQLRDATDAFSHFTRVTQSQAEQVKIHSERLVREFNERMSTVAEGGLSEVMKAWRKSVQAITSDGDRLVKQIDEEVSAATARTEMAWRGLAQDAASVTESAGRRLATDAKEMATMSERLASANRGLTELAAVLEEAARSTRSLGDTAAGSAIGLEDRVADVVAAYQTLTQGARKYQEVGLQEYRDAVSQSMEEASRRLERDGARLLESAGTVTEAAEAGLKRSQKDAAAARSMSENAFRTASRSLTIAERVNKVLDTRVPVGMGAKAPPGRDAPVERMRRWSGQVVRKLQKVSRES